MTDGVACGSKAAIKGGTCGWEKKAQELPKVTLLLNSHCELQSYRRVSCWVHQKVYQKVTLVLCYGGVGKMGRKLLGL